MIGLHSSWPGPSSPASRVGERNRGVWQAFLAEHPAVLTDGRSPAPRAVGDLLIALRKAGAEVSPPVCAECGKPMRTLQRRGQDWYCGACSLRPAPCAACGQLRHISTRDRAGGPRCAQCPDRDDRDPISVIHDVVARLDPTVDRNLIASAVGRLASRPAHQRRIGLGVGSSTRIAHRRWASRPCPRDRPADRCSARSRRCRDRPTSLPPLRSRRRGSTNPSTGSASAAPASPTPASKNAHAAAPAANRPLVTSTADRCVRTVWSPTPTTSKSASTAVAVVRSASGHRTGRSAAPARPCRPRPARSAVRKSLAAHPESPAGRGVLPASAARPDAVPADGPPP